MLHERTYMRGSEKQIPHRKKLRDLTAVQVLLLANIAVYLVQMFFLSFLGSNWVENIFSLSATSLKHGYLWTFASYAFLHGGLLHIFVNMLVLYFIGPLLEARIGKKVFYILFFAAAGFGGIAWLLLNFITGTQAILIGASAGVFGIFTAFCMLEPDRKMTFLLFFVIPVNTRPRILLAFLVGFEFFQFLFYEIAPYGGSFGIGYSAHLGGIMAGVAAYFILAGKIKNPFFLAAAKKFQGSAADYSFKVDILSDADLKAEVNRILDKLNSNGFSSLSEREKEILSIAKDRMK